MVGNSYFVGLLGVLSKIKHDQNKKNTKVNIYRLFLYQRGINQNLNLIIQKADITLINCNSKDIYIVTNISMFNKYCTF